MLIHGTVKSRNLNEEAAVTEDRVFWKMLI